MINFLHNFQPQAILWSGSFFDIRWYGLLMVTGISLAIISALLLAKAYGYKTETILDLSFWLIIGGLLGARVYEIFLEWPYYYQNTLSIFKIWQGGLAIHGAIIGGLISAWLFTHKNKLDFWFVTALVVPGLALGQAIGRFGNYFNQELFGLPTDKPWGIPIDPINRPLEYIGEKFFHPTFIYESFGSLIIFLILIAIHVIMLRKLKSGDFKKIYRHFFIRLTAIYLILYSLLRFFLEFIKVDQTPKLWGWRWPQIISLVIIFLAIPLFFKKNKHAEIER
ncbi:MAG: prolipoprotein diacylglyceryl transferase [Patescibacteria group bacterium]